jgi:DNA ligase D-like protein (predicted ligase)
MLDVIPRVMLATSAASLPIGPDWTYEVKWDGYRAIAVKDGARVRLISRNEKNLTRDYPQVVAALNSLIPAQVVLDGEIVALDGNGRPSFQALQHRSTSGLALVYYAFDLLSLNGKSLVQLPLVDRRRALANVIKGSKVLLSEPLSGDAGEIQRAIQDYGLEGVVAKRRDSVYRPGQRSDAWIKVKFSPQQEFVVGGYKPAATDFDSILVGYYEGRQLYFAAKIRAGFTKHSRAEVFSLIARHDQARCPFVNLPNSTGRSRWGAGVTADDMKGLRWVKPVRVVQVAFVEWTRDRLLRHPKFVGLRDDKSARAVRREAKSS